MNYIEINVVTGSEDEADIVTAMLADFPFDSFDNDGAQVRAYITETDHRKNLADISAYLDGTGYPYSSKAIPKQNWNELWESNFEPIDVEGRCLVRAPFHRPQEGYEAEVVIMPKMSFGTGHHATTYLMAAGIMEGDLASLTGLDMGSGTGVLAILAVKRGARHVDAIDIDPWAKENAEENIAANGIAAGGKAAGTVTAMLGDASLLAGKSYDFILANINRNIIVTDMPAYANVLKKGGFILFSGFLECDSHAIRSHAEKAGLTYVSSRTKDGWVMMRFEK